MVVVCLSSAPEYAMEEGMQALYPHIHGCGLGDVSLMAISPTSEKAFHLLFKKLRPMLSDGSANRLSRVFLLSFTEHSLPWRSVRGGKFTKLIGFVQLQGLPTFALKLDFKGACA